MRNKFLVAALVFITSSPLFAQGIFNRLGDWHFSIEPHIGYTYGQIGEYVFNKISSTDDRKLSELQWDEKPVLTFGADLCGGYKDIFLQIAFTKGMSSQPCGSMEDSDWMNNNDYNMKTTRSISENTLTSYTDVSARAGYTFHILSWLSLAPFAEFEYQYREFSANNAYGWYGNKKTPMVSWDDPLAIYYAAGTLCGIDYSHMVLATFAGGSARLELPHNFSIIFSLAISPFLYEEAKDTHYKKIDKSSSTQYLDIIHAVWFGSLKSSLAVYCALNRYFDLGLTFSARTSWLHKGITATKNSQGKYIEQSNSKSGMDLYELNMRLSLVWHLGGRR